MLERMGVCGWEGESRKAGLILTVGKLLRKGALVPSVGEQGVP